MARQLGLSVKEAQRKIDSREFTEWLAYDSVEPGEPTRGDIQAAVIASTIANANRDPKKKSSPFTIDDFIVKYDTSVDKRRMSQKEIKTTLEILRKHIKAKSDREAKIKMKKKAGRK